MKSNTDNRESLTNMGMGRRRFLAMAAGAGTVAAVGTAPPLSPIGRARAALPVAGAIIAGTAAVYLYDKIDEHFTGYNSEETISKADAEALESDNLHRDIFRTLDSSARLMNGWHTETTNYLQPGNVTASGMYNTLWSIINRSLFESMNDGLGVTDAVAAAREEIDVYCSERGKNYVEQYNELMSDILGWLLMFHPSEWDGESTLAVNSAALANGLSIDSVFRTSFNRTDNIPLTAFGVNFGTKQWYDGTEQTYTTVPFEYTGRAGSTRSYEYTPFIGSSQSYGYRDGIVVTSLDASTEINTFEADIYETLFNALDSIHATADTEISTYAEEVYNLYNAGDIAPEQLLDAQQLMMEFGDADGMTRAAAELTSMGYAGAADLGTQVTLYNNELGLKTGNVYLRWDFDALAAWEYSLNGYELTVDSVHEDSVYTVVFETSGSIGVPAADFTVETDEDGNNVYPSTGTYTFGDTEITEGEAITEVQVDRPGRITSHIPLSQTVTQSDYHSGVFVWVNEQGEVARKSLTGDFELQEVIAEDGTDLDRLTLTGYNQQSRDPARALSHTQDLAEDRETVSDLETGAGGGASGAFSGSSAMAIGALAALLAAFGLSR